MLDVSECEKARVARDPRYDGRFFTGVRTTRIYCRPVCPVRPAKSGNVTFYPSAAAAEAAGFRPCLRCRPESAPFSPAWKGSRTTVERALRLIANGALDVSNVEALAARLGIGGPPPQSAIPEAFERQPAPGRANRSSAAGEEIAR
jgi:AraC family transcriptional regulator of adaptative response / DNA-3-methyladenine glycosylase II